MRSFIFSLLLAFPLLVGCKTGKVCDARGDSPDFCEIHHSWMRSEKFPNPHLTTPPSQDYLEVRTRYFRHSKPVLFMLPDECKYCMVHVCEECVQAEEQWKALHKIK